MQLVMAIIFWIRVYNPNILSTKNWQTDFINIIGIYTLSAIRRNANCCGKTNSTNIFFMFRRHYSLWFVLIQKNLCVIWKGSQYFLKQFGYLITAFIKL
jgi:hypothetical protein